VARFKTSFVPSSDALNANEIYSGALYKPEHEIVTPPASPGSSFEALNGSLSRENVSGTLGAHCFRAGTFARGHYYGFNFPDRFHASQFIPSSKFTSGGGDIPNKIFTSHYSVSYQFFCPWPAVCFIGYQGFFAAEATQFDPNDFTAAKDTEATYDGESWHMRLLINGDVKKGSFAKIPNSRRDGEHPGQEHRWRWVHRSRSFEASKGYNTVELRVWPNVLKRYAGFEVDWDTPDKTGLATKEAIPLLPPKLVTLTGGIWVLALRRGTDSDSGPVEHTETEINVGGNN
tara:strand:+ start:4564 stop:5427 length:864 start_codon:yes stop_codon:yes gene_type:complete